MSELAVIGQSLPPTPFPALEKLAAVQERILAMPQAEVRTEHVIHGGMYARTVYLTKDMVITGALIKKATVVIVSGHSKVLVGDEWADTNGYCVIPASAGRKQLFVALGDVALTMIFPTQAKTIEEAENEFTDEAELLLSRRQGGDIITITGE